MNQSAGSRTQPNHELWEPPLSRVFPPSSSSSSSYQPHLPFPSHEIPLYIQAIRSAGPHQAKKALFEAVLRSDRAAKLASLMQLRREDVELVEEEEEDTPLLVECERCDKEFDVYKNDEPCFYHSGKLKCTPKDQENWEDNDGRGRLNTKKNREEYPHLFTWSCCGSYGGGDDGCKSGKHVEPDE